MEKSGNDINPAWNTSRSATQNAQDLEDNTVEGIDDLDMAGSVEQEDIFVEGYPSADAARHGGQSEKFVTAFNFATNEDSDTSSTDPGMDTEDTMSGANNDGYASSPDTSLEELEEEGYTMLEPLEPGEIEIDTPDLTGLYYDSPTMGDYANRQLGTTDRDSFEELG